MQIGKRQIRKYRPPAAVGLVGYMYMHMFMVSVMLKNIPLPAFVCLAGVTSRPSLHEDATVRQHAS